MKSFTLTKLERCARCGENHYELLFEPLSNAQPDMTHWAMCPSAQQPILLRIQAEDDQPPYVLFSKKHTTGEAIWWRPSGAGYTRDLLGAGRYTEEEARRIEEGCHGDTVAVRFDEVVALFKTTLIDLGWGDNRVRFKAMTGGKS